MIQRIELVNFMSHHRTVIEPAAGLTVLIGQNNVGKSALVAALQILAANDPSTFVMRHDAKDCSVTVQTVDEQGATHTIVWARKNSPSYTIDGQRFDRLKNELPEELHPILRLPRIQVGSNAELDVHIASQKNPIFLLDSQANAARLFASSSDTSKMLEIQKRHKEKQAAANQEQKRLAVEAAENAANLAKLEPLAALDAQLHQAEARYQEWLAAAQQIAAGHELLQQLQAAASERQRRAAEHAALAPLAAPPELTPIEPCARLIADLQRVTLDRAYANAESAATEELVAPPELPATQPLADLARALARLELDAAWAAGERAALAELIAPPALENDQLLRRLVEDLAATEQARERLVAEHGALRKLRALPAAESLAELQKLCGDLERWQHELTSRQHTAAALRTLQALPAAADPQPLARMAEELQRAAEQLALQQLAWQAAAAEFQAAGADLSAAAEESSCPTCGQPFDPQRLLDVTVGSGGHPHG